MIPTRRRMKKQKTSMIGVEIKAAFLKRRLTPSAWFSLQNDEWKFISNHFARFVPPCNHIHLEELFIVLLLSSLKFSNKGFHCKQGVGFSGEGWPIPIGILLLTRILSADDSSILWLQLWQSFEMSFCAQTNSSKQVPPPKIVNRVNNNA